MSAKTAKAIFKARAVFVFLDLPKILTKNLIATERGCLSARSLWLATDAYSRIWLVDKTQYPSSLLITFRSGSPAINLRKFSWKIGKSAGHF
jgi:hypothetical protein